ncbi:hypothetical protein ES707_15418 [subsurface metagenome]
MQPRKYPIRLPSQVTVDADGTGYVRSEIMKVNRVLDCQSLAFRNRTGARGNMEIYIKQGEQIEAQQASCIAGDVLDLHIIGHITYEKEGRDKLAVPQTQKPAPEKRRTPRVELPFHPGRSKSPVAYEV